METERPWQSRTMWKSLIATVIGIATVFGIDFGITPEQQVELLGAVMIVVGALSAWLRTHSTKKITMKPDG